MIIKDEYKITRKTEKKVDKNTIEFMGKAMADELDGMFPGAMIKIKMPGENKWHTAVYMGKMNSWIPGRNNKAAYMFIEGKHSGKMESTFDTFEVLEDDARNHSIVMRVSGDFAAEDYTSLMESFIELIMVKAREYLTNKFKE